MKYLKRFNEDSIVDDYMRDSNDSYIQLTPKFIEEFNRKLISIANKRKEIKITLSDISYLKKICNRTMVNYEIKIYNFSWESNFILLKFDRLQLTIRKYENDWFYVSVTQAVGIKNGQHVDFVHTDFVCNDIEGLSDFLTDLIRNKKYPYLYEGVIVDDYMKDIDEPYLELTSKFINEFNKKLTSPANKRKQIKITSTDFNFLKNFCKKEGIKFVLIHEKGKINMGLTLEFNKKTELTINKYDNNWFCVNVSKQTGWVDEGGYANRNYRDFICNDIEGLTKFIKDLIVNKKFTYLYD